MKNETDEQNENEESAHEIKAHGKRGRVNPSQYLFLANELLDDYPTNLSVGNRIQWILTNINFTLGVGPLWRFPVVAYRNSGGSFLMAYVVTAIFVGYPLTVLEVALGQTTKRRASNVFKLCAAIEGLHISMGIYSFILPIYHSVLFAYSLFYFYNSFSDPLIWSTCGLVNSTYLVDKEYTCIDNSFPRELNETKRISPNEVFWMWKVLGGHKNREQLSHLGPINEKLMPCLALAWLWLSILLVQKVRKFTIGLEHTFTPAVLLLMIIIMSLCLASTTERNNIGSARGIKNFFYPNADIFRIQIWREATQQVLYSLGIASGPLITLGSLSHFRSPVHIDSAIVCAINLCFTVISGVVLFLAAGIVAQDIQKDAETAEEINKYGGGMFFIAYSRAMGELPFPSVWSALFFLLLVATGSRAMLGTMDTSVSVIMSFLPRSWWVLRSTYLIGSAVCCASLLLGMLLITKGDTLVFHVLNTYPGACTLPFLAFVECVGVVWIYGLFRFVEDVEYMLGFKPSVFYQVVWLLIPIYLMFLMAWSWISWTSHLESSYMPLRFNLAGWILVLVVVLPVPIHFIVNCVCFYRKRRVSEIFQSRDDLGPDDLEVRFHNERFFDRPSIPISHRGSLSVRQKN